MLRLLNKSGLPNVVTYELSDPAYNTTALLSGFTIKERDFYATSKTLKGSRANKYLSKQFNRLVRASEERNLPKFNKIGVKLLTKSIAFLVYAFHSVMPKWTGMFGIKGMNLLYKAHLLRQKMETDIDYKRLWIDKKPGDYGRPLGVPIAAWRIYLRMVTNIGEAFAKGQDLYSPHQHGGRPGYGVMSCLREVSTQLENHMRVYEFDLKGFFDHISHESMTTIFKDTFLESLFNKMLKSKPKGYEMPPEEKDKAQKALIRSKKEADLMESFGLGARPLTRNTLTQLQKSSKPLTKFEGKIDRGMYEMMRNSAKPDKSFLDLFNPISRKASIKTDYKSLMETGQPVNLFNAEPYKKWKAEIGREDWKDLNLPNQGVPQGSAFGPFLSSLAVSVYFKKYGVKDWIMYIDDGLFFHNNKEELVRNQIKATKALERMKVEIEPTKSRLHTRQSLMSNSIKFLGVRFKKVLDQSRTFFTMSSDTRSGVQRELPPLDQANILTILENLLKDKLITMSKYKYAQWTIEKSRLGQIVGANHVNLAIKYGYFGYLLSWLYNPEADISELKQRIKEGNEKAIRRILRQEKSWGALVLNTTNWHYQDEKGMYKIVRPDLNNHSTLCVDLLLETLQHGFVSLREFGLVSHTDRIIYSNTIGYKGSAWKQVPQYSSTASRGASQGSSNFGYYEI